MNAGQVVLILLLLVGAALAVTYVSVTYLFYGRLRRKHHRMWLNLGSPRFGGLGIGIPNQLALMQWWDSAGYVALGDSTLTRFGRAKAQVRRVLFVVGLATVLLAVGIGLRK